MALTVKKTEGEFELTPQGTFAARCHMVVDLGVQDGMYGPKHKIRIAWELPTELMKDGRPFVIGKEYTASLHKDSNLAQDLVAWRGKTFTEAELEGFDMFKVLGAPCMVTVIHSSKGDKTYANVKSVTALPKGMTVPPPINEPLKYSIEENDTEAYSKLPEWIQKKINKTGESNHPAFSTPSVDVEADIHF
jgi:hypothetical protein